MRQAKDFAAQDLGQTYNVDLSDGKIILNIGETQDDKGFIRLKKKARPLYYKVTGNKFIDTYNRINAWLLDNAKIKIKDKATFFSLLGVMLNAGLPLVKSLDSLAIQTEKNVRFSRIIFELARSVEHGGSLSKAMRSYEDVFTTTELGMIEAGEVSGQLNTVLDNLAVSAEKSNEIQSKVKGALLYPAFVVTLLVAVIGVMFVYIIPKLKDFFANSGTDLPTITKVVVGVSDFMVAYWTMISITLLLTVLFFILWKKTDQGHKTVDGWKIKFPIFGAIIKKMLIGRFARNFSDLLGSSVAIISSLEIAAHAVGNDVYKERILMSAEDLKQGIPLGESLKDNPLFPIMFVNIVEVGEKTAQLDTVTAKIAAYYDQEVDTTINSISRVIEPILLVGIGLTVGIVVLAIMLPIIKLTDLNSVGAF